MRDDHDPIERDLDYRAMKTRTRALLLGLLIVAVVVAFIGTVAHV